MVDKDDEIVKVIIGFYENLYKTVQRGFKGFVGVDWMPISNHLVGWLERPFEEDEIRRAIFECEENKAPGPDGFTMVIFQTQWNLIKDDLVKVFKEFHWDGVIHGKTNETYICLIPKILDSCNVNDFCPISLVTSLYKIISKVLSLRLRQVLQETILEVQGFGRQILDVILVANEIVEDYRANQK